MSLKKKIAAAFIACAMTLAVVPSAFACTALYVGNDLTEDGTTMFGRIEDLGTNDYNKLFNISPAGKHTAGEVYEGCYGFTYTFTHDSYRYTARRDDNGLGVAFCAACGPQDTQRGMRPPLHSPVRGVFGGGSQCSRTSWTRCCSPRRTARGPRSGHSHRRRTDTGRKHRSPSHPPNTSSHSRPMPWDR